MLGLLILHLGQREREYGLSYVVFSRAIKLSYIGIAGGIDSNCITTIIRVTKKVKLRLEEDMRLDGIERHTILKLNYRGAALLILSLSY